MRTKWLWLYMTCQLSMCLWLAHSGRVLIPDLTGLLSRKWDTGETTWQESCNHMVWTCKKTRLMVNDLLRTRVYISNEIYEGKVWVTGMESFSCLNGHGKYMGALFGPSLGRYNIWKINQKHRVFLVHCHNIMNIKILYMYSTFEVLYIIKSSQ